jgi:acyl-CoA thioester hydrolase
VSDAATGAVAPAPFTWTSRVYWEDTDGGGVVYYANYLRFLERARTEWLRARGHQQREIAEQLGLLFVVVRVEIDYRSAAKLDDLVVVTCEPRPAGRIQVDFQQRIHRGSLAGDLVAEARVRAACVDARTLHPRRLPEFVR